MKNRLVILGSCLLMTACAQLPAHHGVLKQVGGQELRPALTSLRSQRYKPSLYRLEPGDELRIEISLARRNIKVHRIDIGNSLQVSFALGPENYRILPGDILAVSFDNAPQLNFEVRVQPDGMVALGEFGRIDSSGKTPADLALEMRSRYRERLADSEVSVAIRSLQEDFFDTMNRTVLVQQDGRVSVPGLGEVLVAGLTATDASRQLASLAEKKFQTSVEASVVISEMDSPPLLGFNRRLDPQSTGVRSLLIGPDGTISFPGISHLVVADMTLAEVSEAIQEQLGTDYKNPLDISVALVSPPRRSCFVGGEVARPGEIEFRSGLSLLQSIAMSGWVRSSGNLQQVKLIRQEEKGTVVYTINLQDVIDGEDSLADLQLMPRDLVYIPKTGIANLGKVVDQYINRILPFSRNVNVNVGNYD